MVLSLLCHSIGPKLFCHSISQKLPSPLFLCLSPSLFHRTNTGAHSSRAAASHFVLILPSGGSKSFGESEPSYLKPGWESNRDPWRDWYRVPNSKTAISSPIQTDSAPIPLCAESPLVPFFSSSKNPDFAQWRRPSQELLPKYIEQGIMQGPSNQFAERAGSGLQACSSSKELLGLSVRAQVRVLAFPSRSLLRGFAQSCLPHAARRVAAHQTSRSA